MIAAAVGALHDQIIGVVDEFRVPQDGQAPTSQVAREHQPLLARALLIDIQHHDGAAQDVPRVVESQGHARRDGDGPPVGHADEVRQRGQRVLHRVKGLQRRFALAPPFLVQIADILLLDAGAVFQHRCTQITRSVSGVDVALEPLSHQIGDVARVIDVGVREHHHVDIFGIEGEIQVAFIAELALALVKTAIQQDFGVVDFQQVHGAGDGAGRAPKCDFHHSPPDRLTAWSVGCVLIWGAIHQCLPSASALRWNHRATIARPWRAVVLSPEGFAVVARGF